MKNLKTSEVIREGCLGVAAVYGGEKDLWGGFFSSVVLIIKLQSYFVLMLTVGACQQHSALWLGAVVVVSDSSVFISQCESCFSASPTHHQGIVASVAFWTQKVGLKKPF